MSDVTHYLQVNGIFSARGKVLNDVRIRPYLKERGFVRRGSEWKATIDANQIADFLVWVGSRGWSTSQGKPPVVRPKVANLNITYSYGTAYGEPNAQLRGGGTKSPQVNQYIVSQGFRWTFRRGMRNVRAWEAPIKPLKLIEVLLHLKSLGYHVEPSSSLAPKKWLYLDLPKIYNKRQVRSGEQGFGDLIQWLEENKYQRLSQVENPGDFSILGGSVYVWTKQDDSLIRIIFDGETVESIAVVDPEKQAEFVSDYTINGLKETGTSEPLVPVLPAPVPIAVELPVEDAMAMYADIAEKMQGKSNAPAPPIPTAKAVIAAKYAPSQVGALKKKFQLLDDKHPFFGMVKFEDNSQ